MDHAAYVTGNFEARIARPIRARAASAPVPERAFYGVISLLFVVSAAVTVLWCNSMSAMQGMAMPGGWTMSMAWMRMPGQTWATATASFAGMWIVMMAAMMLPSLAPMLGRYRQSLAPTSDSRRDRLTALAGLGYFFVWALFGLAVFPVGVATTSIEMARPALARAAPIATALVVLLAGALRFTQWKAHHLNACREAPGSNGVLRARAGAAWRQGLHFGFHCGLSCANLTAILLIVGVMDLRAMTAVTAAVTAERLAPASQCVARAIGAVVVVAGLFLMARALGLQ
jgi:predicted metal-binding membrane protein